MSYSDPLLPPQGQLPRANVYSDTIVTQGNVEQRDEVKQVHSERPTLAASGLQFSNSRPLWPDTSITSLSNDSLKRTDRGKDQRLVFPAGDVYFQNVRCRVVVTISFVFVFRLAVNFALQHFSYEVTAINLAFLLALAPPMMATFPDAGNATLIVGWVTMSAYHAMQLYVWLDSPDSGYQSLLVGLYCAVQQVFYLRMAVVSWSPACLPNRVVAANGEHEALELLAYTRQLWRWSSPDHATSTDALRSKYASVDPSDPAARYSRVRRIVDRWIDVPVVGIPVGHVWSFPTPVPAISIANPTKLPLLYVVVQWCTLTVILQLAGVLLLPPGPWNDEDRSAAEMFGMSEWQVLLTTGFAVTFCLGTMSVLTGKVRAAVNNVQRGVYNPDTKKLTAPWRMHKYIGQQMFVNLALLIFTIAIAVACMKAAGQLWDLLKSKLLSVYVASWCAALLQRALFARVLCDKTSVRHFRLAVAVSHVIALLSIVGGLADLTERVLWCVVSLVLNFAIPIHPITAPGLVFLDHLHRSLWSLIFLNNDCCHPVKQVMSAALTATEELVFLRGQHAAESPEGAVSEGTATSVQVRLCDVGRHLMMPTHRHLVRYFVLHACGPNMSLDEAFAHLQHPERTVVTVVHSTTTSRAEDLRRQRIVSRWWLLLVLLRRPSLALQRKHHLWSTTFAIPPIKQH